MAWVLILFSVLGSPSGYGNLDNASVLISTFLGRCLIIKLKSVNINDHLAYLGESCCFLVKLIKFV